MSLEVIREEGETIIRINDSSLVDQTVEQLKIDTLKLIEKGDKKIALDLSNTNYIDSSGIGKILFINKKMISSGGVLRISRITPTLLDFFITLAIDKIIPINRE